MEYGTGAIMGVPRARRARFRVRQAVRHPGPAGGRAGGGESAARREGAYVAHTDDEVLVNSGEFTGLSAPEGKREIVEWLE